MIKDRFTSFFLFTKDRGLSNTTSHSVYTEGCIQDVKLFFFEPDHLKLQFKSVDVSKYYIKSYPSLFDSCHFGLIIKCSLCFNTIIFLVMGIHILPKKYILVKYIL